MEHTQPHGADTAPAADRAAGNEAIRETLELYYAGLRDGDVGTLKKAFRPEAIVSGYIGEEAFVKPVDFLYEFVEENESPAKRGDPFKWKLVSTEVAGGTATVRITEHDYLDVDYRTSLHLMDFDGRWWIVSKLFDGTPTGS